MKVDIAIITIRPDEFKAVRSLFETEERHIPGGRTYLIGEVKTQDGQTYTIAIARCSDQGNDASQRLAHSIIHHLDPQLILVVGIAGGIPHDDFTLGDVVLSTRIVNPNVDAWHADGDTDYIMRGGPPHPLVEGIISLLPGKPQLAGWAASIQPERPDLDPERVNIKGDDEWREKVGESLKWHFREEENRGRSSTFIAGPILSSNHLMKDPARLGVLLKTHRDIFAVEMEVAGVYEAAYGTPHYPVMAIRGISDIVGLQRDRRWTAYACQAAAAFTHAFIMTNPLKLQTAAGCPYRGLDVFAESDHDFFFGRERDTSRLLDKLRGGSHFMAILGPSGSGKSSLVQAGLIRELRNEALSGSASWEFITSRPANDLFVRLAPKGLAGTSNNLLEKAQAWRGKHPEKERLVLVFDQFEELWTSCSPELAQEFIAQLTQLLKAPYHEYLTLIVIMRNDFYPYSVENGQFAALMEQGTINILPELRRSEFDDIIQKPASKRGMQFADGLVATILEDILKPASTSPDGDRYGPITVLPLLEFALTALWNECKRRQDEELTHSVYLAIGGVSGALAQWAEKAYQRIEERLQPLARHIFTNLVYLDDEKRGLPKSRIRRTLGELCPVNSTPNDVHQVVHQLATERLLVASRDTGGQEWVEIIHDVLVEKWESLRKWLDEDRPFLSWHQELQRRFQLWVETDPTDPLLRDEGRLLRGRDLDEAEHWMAERSLDFDPIEQDFIKISRKNVERQHQATIARQLVTHSELIRIQQPELIYLSVILAAEAMRRDPSVGADQALRSAIAFIPHPFAQMSHEKMVKSLAFSPDGRYLATASADCTALIWEVPHAISVHSLIHQGAVNALVFSPDGQCLATASSDHTLGMWDVTNWHQITSLVHQGPLSALTFSVDGHYLAAASEDGTATIWQLANRQQVATLNHKKAVNALAFSPDGHYLATVSSDCTGSLWEVPGGKQLAQLLHRFPVRSVAFSPDGHSLVTASEDGTVGVWEVPSGKQLQNLKHDWQVGAVIFSPDGHYLVTAGGDKYARVWKMPDGHLLTRLPHVGNTRSAAFSPDGRYLATTGNAMVRVCEVGNWHQIACLIKGYELHSVVFSPDGKHLASAGQGSTAEVWEISDKPSLAHITCQKVKAMAFTPDSQHLVAAGDSVAVTWDLTRREHLSQFTFRTFSFGGVRFSPDGRYLAVLSDGLWDTVKGREVVDFMGQTVAFSSDGSYLATTDGMNTVVVLKMKPRRSTRQLSHNDAVNIIAFSPDGQYLATASDRPSGRSAGRKSPVVVWELPHGTLLASLDQEEYVNNVLFSPKNSFLAVLTNAGVMVWETSTRSQLIHVPRQSLSISDAAFSPDEQYFAIAGSSTIQVYDVIKKHFLDPLEHMVVTKIMFSPNGRYLASMSDDNNACVWELPSGSRLAYLGHGDRVTGIAFSPDSHYIATASWDNTVGIWETTTGLQLCRLSHDNKVTNVAFSPNGKYIMSLDWDDILRVWLWRPEDVIAEAYAHMPRNLTREEWQTYLGNEPYRKTFEESL